MILSRRRRGTKRREEEGGDRETKQGEKEREREVNTVASNGWTSDVQRLSLFCRPPNHNFLPIFELELLEGMGRLQKRDLCPLDSNLKLLI